MLTTLVKGSKKNYHKREIGDGIEVIYWLRLFALQCTNIEIGLLILEIEKKKQK